MLHEAYSNVGPHGWKQEGTFSGTNTIEGQVCSHKTGFFLNSKFFEMKIYLRRAFEGNNNVGHVPYGEFSQAAKCIHVLQEVHLQLQDPEDESCSNNNNNVIAPSKCQASSSTHVENQHVCSIQLEKFSSAPAEFPKPYHG